MLKRLLLLPVLIATVKCHPAFGEEPKLTIQAETDKTDYNLWEVIDLKITITNQSRDTVFIYSPDFWGVTEIDIYNEGGALVKPELLKINRIPDDEIWKLSPGESRSHTYDNLKWYSCCFGNMYTEKELPAGNYLINLSISCPPDRKAEYIPYQNSWVGTLYANTVRFSISGLN